MSLALVRKETREHAWVLVPLVLLDALVLWGSLLKAGDEGGRFSALAGLAGLLPLTAVVAAERLLAREYGGHTQLFLEVLPLSRARVLATKWALGAALVLGLLVSAWLVVLRTMRETEVISWEDAGRALAATAAYTLVVWSFAAMAAMLGRYRWVAWLGVVFFYGMLQSLAEVPVQDAPVLELLSAARAVAREPVPTLALVRAGVAFAAFTGATAALGLAGAGALPSALAGRMTARERVFILAAALVGFWAEGQLTRARSLPPFELKAALRSPSSASVGVLPGGGLTPARAVALADAVAGDLADLAPAVGLEGPPPVWLMAQRGLEPTETLRADLAGARAVVLRMSAEPEEAAVRGRVLHEVLTDASEVRAHLEDRHVLLDGLATWWAVRADADGEARWWRRAAASPVPLTVEAVARWDETQERLGPCQANALAFALVETLVETVGWERTLGLAGRLLARPAKGLAWLRERSPAVELAAAGTGWEALIARAEAHRLERLRREAGAAPVPPARATLALRRGADGVAVVAEVAGVERWRLLHGRLGPWTRGTGNLPRLDVKGSEATLPLTLAPGSRVLAVVEHDDPRLGCPVRLAVARLEVE